MKRMSIGQTVLHAVLVLVLLVGLLRSFSVYVFPNTDLIRQIQQLVAYLPESMRMPLIGLVLILGAVILVVLLFYLSGKLISLALRIVGKDPVKQYRAYNQLCREKMGSVENPLQLEHPAYRSTRIRKVCTRIVLTLLCLLVFVLVIVRMISAPGRILAGVLLGLLAALGVLVVYFLLWLLANTIIGRFVRIRRIKK